MRNLNRYHLAWSLVALILCLCVATVFLGITRKRAFHERLSAIGYKFFFDRRDNNWLKDLAGDIVGNAAVYEVIGLKFDGGSKYASCQPVTIGPFKGSIIRFSYESNAKEPLPSAAELSECRNLTELRIEYVDIDSNYFQLDCIFPNVEYLSLAETKISDLNFITDKRFPKLSDLDVQNTMIDDEGLSSFYHSGVERFMLEGTKVTEAGLESLAKCKSLSNVYVLDGQVDSEFDAAPLAFQLVRMPHESLRKGGER
jgi:hypothetical protein